MFLTKKTNILYAILDIETTGGKFNEESITEIAIYKFDGHNVIDKFVSKINPKKPILKYVERLTGLNNNMLEKEPKFYQVSEAIIEITKNSILVAHNAEFDYRVLSTEFNRLNYEFKRNTLCTIALSRILIQNQSSYSLGRLTKSLGIPLVNRHRAEGDALATVKLFKLLLEKDTINSVIPNSIKYFDTNRQQVNKN